MNSVVCDLGTLAYSDALDVQRAVARARASGVLADDVLLLVEHPPVVTLGRGFRTPSLPLSRDVITARGADVIEVDRGGDVTFHGPGQLVGYPILDLRLHRQDLHWYLRRLEDVLIEALRGAGLEGRRNPGYTGVWTRSGPGILPDADSRSGEPPEAFPGGVERNTQGPAANLRKIASIGVHARDWITWHGFALNVATDLSWFDLIVPCGLAGVTMTSIERERPGESVTMSQARELVCEAFGVTFGYESWRARSPDQVLAVATQGR